MIALLCFVLCCASIVPPNPTPPPPHPRDGRSEEGFQGGFHRVRLSTILGSALHYSDVILGAMASQITTLTIVYSTIYTGADQRKHQSFTPLAFVRGIHRWPVNSPQIHRWPVNSPHKGPVTGKMFPFSMTASWCGTIFDITQISGHLANMMSKFSYHLRAVKFGGVMVAFSYIYQNFSSSSGWYILQFLFLFQS